MTDPIKVAIDTVYNGRGASQAAEALGKLDKAVIAASRSQAANATALARLDAAQARSAASANAAAVSAQKLAQAEARTAAELAKADAAQTRAAASALRLQQAQEKAARPGRGLVDTLQGINNAASAVGLGFAAAQAISFAQASIQLSTATNTAKNSLQALAGSPKLYADALAAARQQQVLFGGSLQENISGIQGLITVSRSSGVELQKLIDITQRLSVKDPAQGIAGARIALNEALAGDPTSLAKRYEIPRAALAKIRDESISASEKLAILDQYLAGIGITSEVASGSIDKNALAFNRLGAAVEAVQLQGGQALADFFAPVANGATLLLEAAASGETFAATLPQIAGGLADATNAMTQMGGGGLLVQQAMRDAGIEISGAGAMAAQSAGWLQQFDAWLQQVTGSGERQADAATHGAAATDAYSAAAQDAQGRVEALVTAQTEEGQALVDVAGKRLEAAHAAQQQAAFDADLAALAGQVAGGHLSVGAAAIALAGRWHIASDAAERLIGLQAQIAGGVAGTRGNQRLTYGQSRDMREQRMAGAGPQEASASAQRFVADQKARAAATQDARRAQEEYNLAMSSGAQRTALLNTAYQNTVKAYGANSAEAIRAKMALDQHTASLIKGGGAAKAKVSAEEKASSQILDLAQKTADKLAEIDEKAAARRAEAARKLAGEIQTMSADMVASQEANDLDLIGASEDQLADLSAREQAEAKARIAAIEAISEARRTADAGDAELAQEVLSVRQEQIAAQQALDEEYFKKRAAFAGDDETLAVLEQQYAEATAAQADATQVAVDLATQAAQQRAQAIADEKQAVLDAAAQEAAALGKTGESATAAAGRVDKLRSTLASLPTNVTTTIRINEVRTGGGGGGAPAPSGGGSAPAPKAGGASAKGAAFRGLGTSTDPIDRLKNAPGPAPMPAPAPSGGGGGGGGSAPSGGAPADTKAIQDAIDVLQEMAELRKLLMELGPPLDMALVDALAGEALAAAQALGSRFVQLSEEQGKNFEIFTGALSDAIGALSDAADLRRALLEIGPPLNMQVVDQLASEALAAAQALGSRFVQLTEEQGQNFAIFTGAIQDAIGALSDMATLRKDLVEIGPPLNEGVLKQLALDARKALQVVDGTLIPLSEEQAQQVGRYADAAGAAIGLLADAGALSARNFADYQSPTQAQLDRLAIDAERVVRAIDAAAKLYQKEGLESAKLFAETAGQAFDTAKSGLEFFDRLRFSDMTINPADLAQFQASSLAVLGTLKTIGAQAPAGAFAGLSEAAAGLDAWATSMTNLTTVPFGNLPTGGNTTNHMGGVAITIVQQPGQDANALAGLVMQKIGQQMGMRR